MTSLSSTIHKWLRSGAVTCAFITATIAAFAAPRSADDVVVFTIDGQKSTLAEFQRLYTDYLPADSINQNLDHYIDLFVDYKRKLAEAYAQSIDTLPDLQKEYEYYRRDLARPYIEDAALMDSMVRAEYSHYLTQRDVCHIYIPHQTQTSSLNRQRHLADSLRQALSDGAPFEEIATRYSADQTTNRDGGHMGIMPVGRYPWVFEDYVYNLPVGELSPVFDSPFGFHILRVDREVIADSVPTLDQARPDIEQNMKRDGRINQPLLRRLEQLRLTYGPTVIAAGRDSVAATINALGGYNPASRSALLSCNVPLLSAGDATLTVADMMQLLPEVNIPLEKSMEALDDAFSRQLDTMTLECAIRHEEATNTEFSGLLTKFRDGLMIYELTNANVWEAAKDVDGLKAYFATNRQAYRWQKPHYKGWLILVGADSIVPEARALAASAASLPADSAVAMVQQALGKGVRLEHVVAEQGQSPWIDYAVFGAQRPAPGVKPSYADCIMLTGAVITEPEDYTDVKSSVERDYTNHLETTWLNYLRQKYPVKVNRKAFNSLKAK